MFPLDPESNPGGAVAQENTGLLGCTALYTNIPTLCSSSKEKRRLPPTSLGKLHLTEAKNGHHFPPRVDSWFFLEGSWAPAVVGGSGCGSSPRRPGRECGLGRLSPRPQARQGVRAGQKASLGAGPGREGVQTRRESSAHHLAGLGSPGGNPGGEEKVKLLSHV